MRRALTLSAAMLCTALASPAAAQSADDWFGADKALHFTLSAAIAGGGYALGAWRFDDTWTCVALGAGLGLAVGAGKELVDLAGYGDPSWRDLAWDALGTGVGVLAAWGVDQALRGPSSRRARWALTPALHARGASLTLAW